MDETTEYLGDGVYAVFDGYQVWIYTSNGVDESPRIALERDVINRLVEYDHQIRIRIKCSTNSPT